ncbi:MAG TPA: hypothetical protein VLH19_03235 [Patescibacteria group bacterium]|nr:hypothetical protein [Patescibacteria group bacterium]
MPVQQKTTFRSLVFQRNVLTVLLFSLFVIFMWIISSIYFSYKAPTLSTQEQQDIIPLNPKIDTKAIDNLEQRKWWTPQELEQFSPTSDNSGASPTPSALPLPTPVPSATP